MLFPDPPVLHGLMLLSPALKRLGRAVAKAGVALDQMRAALPAPPSDPQPLSRPKELGENGVVPLVVCLSLILCRGTEDGSPRA